MSTERGSLRARTLRQMSAFTVGQLAALAPVNAYTLPPSRLLIEQAMRAGAPPLRATITERVDTDGIHGEWVRGPRADRTDAVVLYIHGGGFVAGSALGYRGVASRLSTATKLPVFTLDYRLAPEHPYPAAPSDVAAAFGWLTRRYSADRIVVAGDSAGGFLAAHLTVENARAGRPEPGALVLFSPMADLSLAIAVDHEKHEHRDGLLSTQIARQAIAAFTTEPFELQPVHGMRLPPTLIHASDTEYFGADATELARRWRATGAHCELQVWPDQMHAFQTLPAVVPESRTAYRAAARFVAAHLDTAPAVMTQKVPAS